MDCKCRNCGKKYDEGKSTSDWKGYCTQKCFHQKAKSQGYRKRNALAFGRAYDEYNTLLRVKEIGSIPWKLTEDK